MAKIIFKKQPAYAPVLFPINLFDLIPKNHPVRLINEIVDKLDISGIFKHYKGGGTSAYHPRMMLKVLFYAYFSNTYSCRKIAKALTENIYFMFISGNSTPDFRTINDFRGKILKDQIKTIFAQIVKMLVEEGYVSLEVQYIDGTKIEAVSNRYTFVWRKSVERRKGILEEKINTVLADIESCIQSDNQDVNKEELPKPINSEKLKERLSEINEKLVEPDKSVAKELKKLQDKHLPKLKEYELQMENLGNRNSYSKTDKDATFMRMKDDHLGTGQPKPAYNPQISTENQFITHVTIHQTAGDTTTLRPHLDEFEKAYGKQSKVIVADAGYGSEENYEMLEEKDITGYVKYNYFHKEQKKKYKNDPFNSQNFYYNKEQDFYVCPMGQRMENVGKGQKETSNGYNTQLTFYQAKNCEGCPLRCLCHKAMDNRIIQVNYRLNELKTKARELLTSEEGLKHRSKRPIEVEAVFGQLKSNNKFNRLTMKGLDKVELEFMLQSVGHNFRKMSAKGATCHKIVLKIKSYGSKIVFKIEIYFFEDSNFAFQRKYNSEDNILKFAA